MLSERPKMVFFVWGNYKSEWSTKKSTKQVDTDKWVNKMNIKNDGQDAISKFWAEKANEPPSNQQSSSKDLRNSTPELTVEKSRVSADPRVPITTDGGKSKTKPSKENISFDVIKPKSEDGGLHRKTSSKQKSAPSENMTPKGATEDSAGRSAKRNATSIPATQPRSKKSNNDASTPKPLSHNAIPGKGLTEKNSGDDTTALRASKKGPSASNTKPLSGKSETDTTTHCTIFPEKHGNSGKPSRIIDPDISISSPSNKKRNPASAIHARAKSSDSYEPLSPGSKKAVHLEENYVHRKPESGIDMDPSIGNHTRKTPTSQGLKKPTDSSNPSTTRGLKTSKTVEAPSKYNPINGDETSITLGGNPKSRKELSASKSGVPRSSSLSEEMKSKKSRKVIGTMKLGGKDAANDEFYPGSRYDTRASYPPDKLGFKDHSDGYLRGIDVGDRSQLRADHMTSKQGDEKSLKSSAKKLQKLLAHSKVESVSHDEDFELLGNSSPKSKSQLLASQPSKSSARSSQSSAHASRNSKTLSSQRLNPIGDTDETLKGLNGIKQPGKSSTLGLESKSGDSQSMYKGANKKSRNPSTAHYLNGNSADDTEIYNVTSRLPNKSISLSKAMEFLNGVDPDMKTKQKHKKPSSTESESLRKIIASHGSGDIDGIYNLAKDLESQRLASSDGDSGFLAGAALLAKKNKIPDSSIYLLKPRGSDLPEVLCFVLPKGKLGSASPIAVSSLDPGLRLPRSTNPRVSQDLVLYVQPHTEQSLKRLPFGSRVLGRLLASDPMMSKNSINEQLNAPHIKLLNSLVGSSVKVIASELESNSLDSLPSSIKHALKYIAKPLSSADIDDIQDIYNRSPSDWKNMQKLWEPLQKLANNYEMYLEEELGLRKANESPVYCAKKALELSLSELERNNLKNKKKRLESKSLLGKVEQDTGLNSGVKGTKKPSQQIAIAEGNHDAPDFGNSWDDTNDYRLGAINVAKKLEPISSNQIFDHEYKGKSLSKSIEAGVLPSMKDLSDDTKLLFAFAGLVGTKVVSAYVKSVVADSDPTLIETVKTNLKKSVAYNEILLAKQGIDESEIDRSYLKSSTIGKFLEPTSKIKKKKDVTKYPITVPKSSKADREKHREAVLKAKKGHRRNSWYDDSYKPAIPDKLGMKADICGIDAKNI